MSETRALDEAEAKEKRCQFCEKSLSETTQCVSAGEGRAGIICFSCLLDAVEVVGHEAKSMAGPLWRLLKNTLQEIRTWNQAMVKLKAVQESEHPPSPRYVPKRKPEGER